MYPAGQGSGTHPSPCTRVYDPLTHGWHRAWPVRPAVVRFQGHTEQAAWPAALWKDSGLHGWQDWPRPNAPGAHWQELAPGPRVRVYAGQLMQAEALPLPPAEYVLTSHGRQKAPLELTACERPGGQGIGSHAAPSASVWKPGRHGAHWS